MSTFSFLKKIFHSPAGLDLNSDGNFRFKWPSFFQWKQVFKVLGRKEKWLLLLCIIMVVGSSSFLWHSFYLKNTEIKPAEGGKYTEGVVGQPRYINPVLSAANEVDRDLTELIFSGLMKYNEKGEVIPDLISSYKVSEDGEIYEVYLKENVLWHDNQKLTSDDVVFTVERIQNSDYKSPYQASWIGVEAEKISNFGVRFKLKNPYNAFLENLTIKILPKHVFETILPENFGLTIYNLKPIGSGPFKFKGLTQDKSGNIKSLDLVRNSEYYDRLPFIRELSFNFYSDEASLTEAAGKKDIDGFSPIWLKEENFSDKNSLSTYKIALPRYFAVFFNLENSKILSEKQVRQALSFATNKTEIVKEALGEEGIVVSSPILSEIFGLPQPVKTYEFNLEKAREILDAAKFKDDNSDGIREKVLKEAGTFEFKSNLILGSHGNEVKELQRCLAKDSAVYPEAEISGNFDKATEQAVIRFQEKYSKEILEPQGYTKGTGEVRKGTRTKLNELYGKIEKEVLPLKITLTVPDQEFLIKVADVLKKQWKEAGVELEIKKVNASNVGQEVIKTRDYESLLFGEVLGSIPDPLPFWHSSQKRYPGLNLSLYGSKEADNLLYDVRQVQDSSEKKEKYQKLQDILIEDAPAVFLFSPDYNFTVSKKIKGIDIKMVVDPSQRFSGIENWYIETKRVWK